MLKLKRHINLKWGDIDMPELDLFKLVADISLDNAILKEAARGNS